MKALLLATTLSVVSLSAAVAQTPSSQSTGQQQRVEAILGALFGNSAGFGGGTSLDAQWAIGRFPLAQQRLQFESRIDAEVRSGGLDRRSADRARADFAALVDLEARYGADRRFTQQERAELNQRYENLTQVISEGGYAGGVSGGTSVADGQRDFDARVDERVRQRRLTRTQATQLKTEYNALVRLESDYLRDGALSIRERDELERRLDALDARVGDAPANTPSRPAEPADRLDAISRALPASGLSAAAQAQLRVEHGDLTRLAAAYRRFNASAEEQAYLDRRLTDLETRARVRRY